MRGVFDVDPLEAPLFSQFRVILGMVAFEFWQMLRFAIGRMSTALCASALMLGTGLTCRLAAADEWTTQVETLIQSKEIATAEKMIVGKLVGDTRNPDLITLLAEVRFDQRRYKEALQLIDEADAISKPTAKGTTLRGLVAVVQSQPDIAGLQFREAIRLDPGYAFAHYYLSRLFTRAKISMNQSRRQRCHRGGAEPRQEIRQPGPLL